MAEHRRAYVEEVAALLLEQADQEVGGVEPARCLVADDQEEATTTLERGSHPGHVLLQRLQRDAVLGQVHLFGPGRQTRHQCQVPAAAAHRLGHEAPL